MMEIVYMYLPSGIKRNDFNCQCISLYTISNSIILSNDFFLSSSVFVYVSVKKSISFSSTFIQCNIKNINYTAVCIK